jgi:hypothetical protein
MSSNPRLTMPRTASLLRPRTRSHLATRGPGTLEEALLRRSVGAAEEHQGRCADCRRAPLIGEVVHVYADERFVCALCRPLRREAPARSLVIASPERDRAVRVVRAA